MKLLQSVIGLSLAVLLVAPVRADEMHFAASSGNLAGLKRLVEVDHRDVDSSDDNGVTPLMSAAASGQMEVLQYLISRGARLDRSDQKGYTALHRAIQSHQLLATRFLLEAGAPVKAVAGGPPPLKLSLTRPLYEYFDLLLKYKADVNESCYLVDAAYLPELHFIRALLRAGADPHQREYGRNALEINCSCQSRDGVDEVHRREVAAALLDAGLKYDEVGADGDSPLTLAAKLGHSEIIELFLKRGASPNTTDGKGNSLLHCAVNSEHLFSADTIRLLVKAGASVNAPNRVGATPLHRAAREGRVELVKTLLEFPQLDRGIKNSQGLTAAELAQKQNHPEIVKLLTR